jgi:hypothetical protein
MRLLPLLALGFLALPEAAGQVRRTQQPAGDSRVAAFWARNGDTRGLGLEAEVTLVSRLILSAEVVRLDFGPESGDQSAAGLGWSERTSYGRFAATYSWGTIDFDSDRLDRQIGRLIYSYDIGRDWQLEVSLNRYENPAPLGDNLTATRFMLRYGNGGPLRLDLGYSRKDALTGVPGDDDTFIAGLSLRF